MQIQINLMSGLKQELGLAQGIGLSSTPLLGMARLPFLRQLAPVAGREQPVGVARFDYLSVPDCDCVCDSGSHYPSAGGVAHFVGMAFGSPDSSESPVVVFIRSFPWFACRATNCCWSRADVWLA